MFSKACEYAIRAAIFIAQQSHLGLRAGLKEIALKIDSPMPFTAKILQQLSKKGLINSIKGPNGGFEMDRLQLKKTRLADIVLVVDGNGIYKTCGLGLKECSERRPCPVHHEFKVIREKLKHMLDHTLISDLALDIEKGSTFLKE